MVIVIAVIAILAGVLIPTFKSVVESAHHSNALQIAKNQMTADTLKYASYGGKIPDDTVYEVDGYYFKVVDNALVDITKEEYDSLFIEIPKNIIYLIPDGAGFGTYDIANAYKKKYSQFAVNGIVDGIKDTVDFSQATPITINAIDGKTINGLYLDEYMIATANTDMYHPLGHAGNTATDSAAVGTALLCGVKTDYVMVGIDHVFNPVANILELARLEGKATGAV